AELDVLRGLDDRDWTKIDQLAITARGAEDTDARLRELHALLSGRGFAVAISAEGTAGGDRHVYAARRDKTADHGVAHRPPTQARIDAARQLTADSVRIEAAQPLTADSVRIDAARQLTADSVRIDAARPLTADSVRIDAARPLTADSLRIDA